MTQPTPGPTSHTYFSQRLRLHYVDWGNPEAPPLLLIHGGRDHCRNWDLVADAFRADYHIIAVDLRGHGDSQWITGGAYQINDFVYDIAQLIDQTKLAPITIIGHSFGGGVGLRYAGLYPENVSKIIAIEGLGFLPKRVKEWQQQPISERLCAWIDDIRKLSSRLPKRYETVEQAIERMQEANPHLSPEQAHHLTIHGINQNEDGTFSWKFDNYFHSIAPQLNDPNIVFELWSRITCPTLLIRGNDSWADDPSEDGRADHFKHVETQNFDDAGHWVHHDQLEAFIKCSREFLSDTS